MNGELKSSDKQKKEVEKFLSKIKSVKQEDIDKLEKEGIFTGSYAINPITKDKIPIYAGNLLLLIMEAEW